MYTLSRTSAESAQGRDRFTTRDCRSDELRDYAALLRTFRAQAADPHIYPGSPAIVARELRPQDRAVLSEIVPAEANALERSLVEHPRLRVERADGFKRLPAWLPPPERRGLIFLDPPYEESREDFARVIAGVAAALQRFATGVYALWYPIKDERAIGAWHEGWVRAVKQATMAAELWLYPRDSAIALNGSGMLIVNPPYLIAQRMQVWLPELQAALDVGSEGGSRVTWLTHPA
jgi:23S rRNA (adenine2030-N6)-methyltransferase